jgi:hypothetical protein
MYRPLRGKSASCRAPVNVLSMGKLLVFPLTKLP